MLLLMLIYTLRGNVCYTFVTKSSVISRGIILDDTDMMRWVLGHGAWASSGRNGVVVLGSR
jgi:hypothetical protein